MSSDLTVPESLSRREVVRWWELRRPLFNLVVMVVGFVSIVGMEWIVTPLLPDGEQVVDSTSVILVVLVYGLLVNVTYTLGWVLELHERKTDQKVARGRGRLLFHLMLAFSLILATGPLLYACAFWLMNRLEPR